MNRGHMGGEMSSADPVLLMVVDPAAHTVPPVTEHGADIRPMKPALQRKAALSSTRAGQLRAYVEGRSITAARRDVAWFGRTLRASVIGSPLKNVFRVNSR